MRLLDQVYVFETLADNNDDFFCFCFFFQPRQPGVWCLIETCPAFFSLYISGTGWHLAESIAQHAQFPCCSSPKECSRAQREKVNLQARAASRGVAISLRGKGGKKSPFLLFSLSLQRFVIFENTQKHQRYF